MRAAVLLLASCFSWLAAPSMGDWPQRRHDAAHTGYTREPVIPPLELKWTFEPAGRECAYLGHDALLAAGDSLFLDAPNVGFFRIDAWTGQVVWRIGERRWVVAVAEDVIIESFAVVRGREVLREVVNAFQVSNGALRWSATTQDVLCNPTLEPGYGCAVREGSVCLSDMRGSVRSTRRASLVWLDARTGEAIAETQLVPPWLGSQWPPEEFEESPYREAFRICAWGRDLMLLMHWEGGHASRRRPGPWAISGDSTVGVTPEEAMYGVHLGTLGMGRTPWVALAERAGVSLQYEGPDNSAEALTCRDARSGELLWSRPLVVPGSRYTPAIDRGTAYIGMYDGTVYALDLFTGETRWRAVVGKPFPEENIRPPGTAESGGISYDAPVCSVAGETVWVLYARRIVALDAASGEVEWVKPGIVLEGYEPVLHGGWLYLLTPLGVEAWGPPPDAEQEEAEYREAQGLKAISERD